MMSCTFRFFRAPICRRVLAGFVLCLVGGCQSTRESFMDRVQEREYFQPTNYQGEARMPLAIRRVLLLPLAGGSIVPPETADMLTEVFSAELQKEQRFEVVRLTRAECQHHFGAEEFSSVAALPHHFLTTLARIYAVDAVLFVDLTAYRGYRPLQLGVRAKLATIKETYLVWSLDEVISGDDPAVCNSVRHFYSGTSPVGLPLDSGQAALQSPTKFAAYVAAATFNTLPPRLPNPNDSSSVGHR